MAGLLNQKTIYMMQLINLFQLPPCLCADNDGKKTKFWFSDKENITTKMELQ
jgi:hypothetical protein